MHVFRSLLIGLGLVTACGEAATPPAAPSGAAEVVGIVDSIRPMSRQIALFRDGLPRPDALAGDIGSADTLAARLLTALARTDTAALARLLVSRAEFGWLIFPAHRYAVAPYELDPAIFWLQLQAGSDASAQRLLARLGGHTLRFERLTCQVDTVQSIDPRLRIWRDCAVAYRDNGLAAQGVLFGSIVAWDDHFKLLSLAH